MKEQKGEKEPCPSFVFTNVQVNLHWRGVMMQLPELEGVESDTLQTRAGANTLQSKNT